MRPPSQDFQFGSLARRVYASHGVDTISFMLGRPRRDQGGRQIAFARLTNPACFRVLYFSDTPPNFLSHPQNLRPQAVRWPPGRGGAQIPRSISPDKQRAGAPR
jgi:hypothetical protein